MHGGDDAEDHAGEQRCQRRAGEHLRVEGEPGKPRCAGRCKGDKEPDPGHPQGNSADPSKGGEDETLRHQLPRDAAARGSEGGAQRDLDHGAVASRGGS